MCSWNLKLQDCKISMFITYLLTPRCRVLLEKLTGLQLVKKFPAFHGTRRFITALTSIRHLSLSWANPIQSTYSHPTSCRSILILSTHLRLGLPSGLFPSGFPTKTLYTALSSPIRATCPAHLTLLDFITRTILGEEYKSFSSSLCSLLHSPVTSSLLGPNMFIITTVNIKKWARCCLHESSTPVVLKACFVYSKGSAIISQGICGCISVMFTIKCNYV